MISCTASDSCCRQLGSGEHYYAQGNLIGLSAEFAECDGTFVDPAAVFLSVRIPSGQLFNYSYGSSAIVRLDVGRFAFQISADSPGRYFYRWWSTNEQSADERSFVVVRANAV